jgi:hypothetical protein
MVKAEQLLVGYFKGYGLRILRSPHLNELLSEDSITLLMRLGAQKETFAATMLWKDHQVAFSLLVPQVDEQGRPCVWNHSIIIPIEPILKEMGIELQSETRVFLSPGQEQTKLETIEV